MKMQVVQAVSVGANYEKPRWIGVVCRWQGGQVLQHGASMARIACEWFAEEMADSGLFLRASE